MDSAVKFLSRSLVHDVHHVSHAGTTALGLALLSAAFSQPAVVGQEKAAKKAKGRLPAYFAQVVTEKRRSEIYTIQKKYDDQLEALTGGAEGFAGAARYGN